MFKVRHKKTGEIRTVYMISGLLGLFYSVGGWRWEYIDNYEPLDEVTMTAVQ